MKKVTKAEFYTAMGPLDVQVSVRGLSDDPNYGTDFKLKNGALVGRTLAKARYAEAPTWKPDSDYFLSAA